MDKKHDAKYMRLLDAQRRANEELIKYEEELDEEYEQYMQPGIVYLQTFNMRYDEDNIEPPSKGTIERVYENLHGLMSWLAGATIILLGGYVTVNMISKLDYNFTDILKKVAGNPKLLGLVLMVIGIAITGINVWWEARSEEDTKAGQMYLKRVMNTGMVVGSLNSQVASIGRADEDFSIGDMIKKLVLSILHVLDFGTGTFKRVIESARNSKITKAGIVTFMIGMVLFIYAVVNNKEDWSFSDNGQE